MQYEPPYGVTDPNASYINGNPAAGIAGSIPPAQAIENPQREIVNLITKGGYVPSDADLFQLTRATRRAAFAFATDTGSQNSLSIAVDPPITAYEQGTELRVLVAYDNTGPATIRVNGLTTQQIVRKDGTPVLAGDLRQNGVAVLVYDGANFQLTSGTTGSVTVTGGWFNGADYMVDTGTPNHIVGTPGIAPTAYAAGQGFTVLVKNQNSGPVDINVNALGVIPIKLPGNVDLAPGDIKPNMLIRLWSDGTTFKMLSPIWMERIDTALTFNVGPNAGADFVDLNAAMFWLSRRRIDAAGSVNFSLQGSTSGNALIHNYSASVVIEHPDGDRLTITGPAPAFIPTPGNFTSTGYSAAAINNDANANINTLRTAFRTELRFNGNFGLVCRGRVGLLQNFMVSGGAGFPTSYNTGINIWAGWTSINCVASVNSASTNWYVNVNASLTGTNFYSVGSTVFSVGLAHSADLIIGDAGSVASSFVVAGAYVDGIQAAHGAIIQITTPTNMPRIYSCGQCGINHWGASSVHCEDLYTLYLGWVGVKTVSANAWVYNAQISYANQGFVVSQQGNIDCSNSYTAAIAAGDYSAFVGGMMYAAGFTNGSAQFSPARNTLGNSNAYIAA
jgi:hypothetical protein